MIQTHLQEKVANFGQMISDLQSIDVIRKVREERIANNNLFRPFEQIGAKNLKIDE